MQALRELPLLKVQMMELQSDVKALKENTQDTKQSYADVLKIRSESESLKGNLNELVKKVEEISSHDNPVLKKNTIEPAIEEIKEREKRSTNVVIFGVPEPVVEDREQRVQREMSAVRALLEKAGDDIRTDDIKIHRVGKYNKDKVRPVKIILPSRELALRVLKQRQKINTDGGIYVKSDQTPLQRQHMKALLRELEERTKNGKEKLKIKYVNSIPRIVSVREQTPKN